MIVSEEKQKKLEEAHAVVPLGPPRISDDSGSNPGLCGEKTAVAT